jgi:hypothetical protein
MGAMPDTPADAHDSDDRENQTPSRRLPNLEAAAAAAGKDQPNPAEAHRTAQETGEVFQGSPDHNAQRREAAARFRPFW